MICFMNLDSPSKSKAYDKGLLFEKLCKDIIGGLGFKEIELRVYKENLEYDISAKSKLNNNLLIGEAKAFERKIKDEIMVFTAKMLTYWTNDSNTVGLFISASDITAPVAGHINQIKETYNLTTICGAEIITSLSSAMNLPNFDIIKNGSKDYSSLTCGETIFLVTDRGYYYIQLLIEPHNTIPSMFVILNSTGNFITDEKFIQRINLEFDILKGLTPFRKDETERKTYDIEEEKSSFLGVLYGKHWFEYQYPSPPDKFIGREKIIENFFEFIDSIKKDSSRVTTYQILSRSGVGKSSLTIKLNDLINKSGDFGVVIDSRNIRSELDLLETFHLLICNYNSKSVNNIEFPLSMSNLLDTLSNFNKVLRKDNHVAVILLDQFESVFNRQHIYNLILDTIGEISMLDSRIVFVISRKNDQPTTYDDSANIDLEKLTNIVKSTKLDDFSYEESIALLSRLKDELGRSLIKELREQVLEISSGFPWLLKKYCAHIIALSKKGLTQKEIAENGMQLENLFKEELDSLDEILREFFERIIHFLPATYFEISERFDDSDLRYKLKSLQNEHRLIRLTGKTYDTYNDVLKEYVKTGNILINKKYIFRLTHTSVLPLFREIVEKDFHSVEDILKRAKRKFSKGTLYIKLNELRRIELIEGSNDEFKVNAIALKSYLDGTFEGYLNTVIKRNVITKKIIEKLYSMKKLELSKVREILKYEMPYIEASDKVWLTYSRLYCGWLKIAGICNFKNNILQLTNQKKIGLVIKGDTTFLPTVSMLQVSRFVETCSDHDEAVSLNVIADEMKRKSLNGLVAAAEFLDLIKVHYRGVIEITAIGCNFAGFEKSMREKYVRDFLLGLAHISDYIERTYNGEDRLETFKTITKSVGLGDDWTEGTFIWRHKILRGWLMYSKLVKKNGK